MKLIDAFCIETDRLCEVYVDKLPAFEEVFIQDGLHYQRVPSVPNVKGLTRTWRNTGLTSNQFYPWAGKAEGYHSQYDSEGRPQFATKGEAKEFSRKMSEQNPHKVTTFDG